MWVEIVTHTNPTLFQDLHSLFILCVGSSYTKHTKMVTGLPVFIKFFSTSSVTFILKLTNLCLYVFYIMPVPTKARKSPLVPKLKLQAVVCCLECEWLIKPESSARAVSTFKCRAIYPTLSPFLKDLTSRILVIIRS